MAKHTKEPWRLALADTPSHVVLAGGGAGPATTVAKCGDDFFSPEWEEACANARRLTAAVNATASLDDAALALLPTVLSSYQHAIEARDRLLTAAKAVAETDANDWGDDYWKLKNLCKLAVAFAETTRPEKGGE